LYLDVWVLRILNQLRNNIVDSKAREENRALGGPYGLFTNEAGLLNDQVLIETFCAETMATYCRLALVDKFKA
jgi:hypothetical protein